VSRPTSQDSLSETSIVSPSTNSGSPTPSQAQQTERGEDDGRGFGHYGEVVEINAGVVVGIVRICRERHVIAGERAGIRVTGLRHAVDREVDRNVTTAVCYSQQNCTIIGCRLIPTLNGCCQTIRPIENLPAIVASPEPEGQATVVIGDLRSLVGRVDAKRESCPGGGVGAWVDVEANRVLGAQVRGEIMIGAGPYSGLPGAVPGRQQKYVAVTVSQLSLPVRPRLVVAGDCDRPAGASADPRIDILGMGIGVVRV